MRESPDERRQAVWGGWGTAVLETDGLAGGQVEGYGSDGIRSSCYTLRNSRPPINPFHLGVVLPAIPQTEEELEFGREDLRAGCASGIYEKIGVEEVREAVSMGRMVSSAFVVWQGEATERKGRFVINFSRQSRHWPKGSVRMETLPGFALNLVKNDHLMSWDVKSGYRHFYLHPEMHDYFLFHYGGRS
jgi:hypothetical protein